MTARRTQSDHPRKMTNIWAPKPGREINIIPMERMLVRVNGAMLVE
jgi:hypothetical protein